MRNAIASAAASLFLLLPACEAPEEAGAEPATGAAGQGQAVARQDDGFSVFLAGDMIVMRPFADVEDPRFLDLVRRMRAADAAVVNLETLFHRFEGYPQADSGGTYMASKPEIAADLAWAGIDMAGTANNHSFDYGSTGVLENLKALRQAKILAAGTGEDLQQARAPRYFYHPKATVALVAAAATFTRYGKASRSRLDLPGRPGLNPLGGPKDWAPNLAAIREAVRNADFTIFSVHAHRQGRWYRELAHQAIDAGADIVLTHGPHRIRGIEIYQDRPIFYSLGDFFYETYFIERLPSEIYDYYGLGDDATIEDLMELRVARVKRLKRRATWEGIGAIVKFKNRGLSGIDLVPLDLGIDKPPPEQGRPLVASPRRGREIIDVVKSRSEYFGTEIDYVASDNIGVIGAGVR